MQQILIKVERIIFAYEQVISRYFVRGTFSGFGTENRSNNGHTPTLPPCGTYPLSASQSSDLSRQFYYNDITNQLIGRKDYFKLTDKKGWRPHDVLYVKDIPDVGSIVISWGIEGIGNHTFTVGNVIGFVNSGERVVQNRYNYISNYPILYPAVRDNSYFMEYLSLHTNDSI
jgi:hypothetical protein